MKKIILSLAIALFSFGASMAAPKFRSLDNRNGKTTIVIEIPALDRDDNDGLSVDDVKLHNNGKIFNADKVDAEWGHNSMIIAEFKKLKTFKNCTLTFTLNGKPVTMNIQNELIRLNKVWRHKVTTKP